MTMTLTVPITLVLAARDRLVRWWRGTAPAAVPTLPRHDSGATGAANLARVPVLVNDIIAHMTRAKVRCLALATASTYNPDADELHALMWGAGMRCIDRYDTLMTAAVQALRQRGYPAVWREMHGDGERWQTLLVDLDRPDWLARSLNGYATGILLPHA